MSPRNFSRRLLTLGLLAVLTLTFAVGAGGCGSGSSSGTASPASTSAAAPARSHRSVLPAASAPTESSPGSSILEFGKAAGGAGKAAVTAAAHSFFSAMASGNYARLCAGLATSNREQLAAIAKGRGPGNCAAALKTLLNPAAATEARKAESAAITSVRIKDATAFVLFNPKGGVPSYFVMRKEGDGWKAISLAPGSPIDPTATP